MMILKINKQKTPKSVPKKEELHLKIVKTV